MRTKAKLEVDLGYFQQNIKILRLKTNEAKILLMVKANAYGHGAFEIVRFAYEKCAIRDFGCATMGEALKLRSELPGRKFNIYVFSETELDNIKLWREYFIDKGVIPVISDLASLEKVLREPVLKKLPLVIKVNIGMNRFGIDPSELGELVILLNQYGRSRIDHLMGHFSHAFNKRKKEQVLNEYELFKKIKNELKTSGIKIQESSVSNSGAIEQEIGIEESFIRPGLLAYGPYLTFNKGQAWGTKNISRLVLQPLGIKEVSKGELIGYGNTQIPHDGILIILPIGYGDGFSDHYYKAPIRCQQYIGKVIGHINMDISFVLFPFEARKALKNNDIYIWGHCSHEFFSFCQKLKILPYKLLCEISPRVPRVYKIS